MNSEMQKFYSNLKDKLKNRNYRIGLDLGVGSIGWCILALNNEENNSIPDEIILSGSRIFEPSIGGKDRRFKRLQRNAHRHKRERLLKLWRLLASKNLSLKAPDNLKKENPLNGDTSRKRFPLEVLRKDPYILRYKALDNKLDLMELGYVIYHLANHRGTASLRTFEEFDENKRKETKEMQVKADNTFELLKKGKYRTYGELIFKEKIEEKKEKTEEKKLRVKIRNSDGKAEFIATRDLAIKELEEILKKQEEFYPEILNKEYVKEITESVNFEYEKLIPKPGHCPYFPEEQKLPKAHPLSEERRLWEVLNNVRIHEPVLNGDDVTGYRERYLGKEEKEKLFNALKKQKEITEKKVIGILNLNEKSEIILQGRDRESQKIKGYRNIKLEQMTFWQRFNEEQKDSFFYDWISSPDDFSLKKLLKDKYGLDDTEIEKAIKEVEISTGYSPIGKTATKILTEYIKTGLSFTEAIDEAVKNGKIRLKEVKIYDLLPYYGEVLSDLTQPVICKALSEKFKDKNYKKPNININEEKWGRIPNPVVHQTLNEIRKLVNEIIKATEKKPVEINMEVSRELKKSSQERERISKEQNANEKERERIYNNYLKGRQINIEKALLKFQLFEEQEKRCPFCCQNISVDDIYNSRVDIEHIFPLSESLDNSRNNLVLAHNTCNETKGQRPPFSAFSGTDKWNDILENLNKTSGLKNKRWRFMEGAYEEFLKNIPIRKRFETDTSYISKSASRYLSCLFDKKTKVVCYKGGLTAQLRLAWDLNGILIPFIKELLYEKERENFENNLSLNIKLRNDHRHHAIDAIVLAYARRGDSNVLNKLSGKGYNIDFTQKNWLSKILVPPGNMNVDKFSQMIKDKLKETIVSIKHNHNPNGELLGETAYGIYNLNKKYFLVSKKKVNKLTDKKNKIEMNKIEKSLMKGKKEIEEANNLQLKRMYDKNLEVLKKIQLNYQKAPSILEQEYLKAKEEAKKTWTITEKRIIEKALEMTGGIYFDFQPNKEKEKFFVLREPKENIRGCGYDTGKSLCLDLYHNEKGKLCGEVIRKINAMRKIQPEYQKKGFKLFERIYGGDILECDVSKDKTALNVKTSNAIGGDRVLVKVTTFTELPAYYNGKLDQIQIQFTNINKSSPKGYDSFYISSMKKYKPRKVILTPLGAIKYRSKILGDINVENN